MEMRNELQQFYKDGGAGGIQAHIFKITFEGL